MALDQAFVEILPDFDNFEGEVSSALEEEFGNAEEVTESGMGRIGSIIATGAAAAAAALAAVGAASIAAAFNTAEFGDSLDKTSARIGVTTDFLQDMQFWASQNGISAESLERAVGRLNQRLGTGEAGASQYVDAIQALGVETQNSSGEVRDAESVFRDVIAELNNMENSSEQAAAAQEIFGTRVARDLLPALREGALTFDEASEAMDGMGRVTEDQIATAVEFSDAWDRAKTNMRLFLTDAATPVMEFFTGTLFPILNESILPLLSDLSNAFGEDGLAGAFGVFQDAFQGGDLLGSIQETMQSALDFLQNNINDIVQFILDSREAIFDAAINIFTSIAEALPEIIPQVIEALVSMVTVIITTLVQAIPVVVEGAILLVTGLVEGILGALPAVIDGVLEILSTVVTTLIDAIPRLLQAGVDLIIGLVTGLITAIPNIISALQVLSIQIIGALITLGPQLLFMGLDLIIQLINGIQSAVPDLIDSIQDTIIPNLLDAIQNDLPQMLEQGAEMMTELARGFAESVTDLVETITEDVIPAIIELFQDNPEIMEAGVEILEALINAMLLHIELMTEFITETLIPLMIEVLESSMPLLTEAGIQILIALIVGIVQTGPQLVNMILTQIIPMLLGAIFQAMGMMFNAGVRILIQFIGGIRSRVPALISFVRGIPGRIGSIFANAGSLLFNAGVNIISGLVNGIRSNIPSVDSVLSGITSRIPDWKGPASVDRALLNEPARNIMEGFANSLDREANMVVRPTMQDLTSALSSPGGISQGSTSVMDTGDGDRDSFVGEVAVDLGEGIERVFEVKFNRRNRSLKRRIRGGAGDAR